MGSSRVKGRAGHDAEDQRPDESAAPLTPEERARLLAELEAEFEAAERSIREEGTITAEELRKHLDAKFKAWEAEEAAPADRLGASLAAGFEHIGAHPLSGRPRPDLTPRPYRFWIKEGYWIVYQLRGTASPLIVAIIDGRRDVGRLLR